MPNLTSSAMWMPEQSCSVSCSHDNRMSFYLHLYWWFDKCRSMIYLWLVFMIFRCYKSSTIYIAQWPAWPFCMMATLLNKGCWDITLAPWLQHPNHQTHCERGNLSFEYVWLDESFFVSVYLKMGRLHLFLAYYKGRLWFVYLSVKVVLWFDRPSHSLTLDPSLCFLPVCASPGHAPRRILRCVSHHWSFYYSWYFYCTALLPPHPCHINIIGRSQILTPILKDLFPYFSAKG